MKAFNFATMTYYGGKNATLVGNGKYPAFATFKQIKDLGFNVKKGSKAVSIFCGYKTKENDENEKVVLPVYAQVFDIIDTDALDNDDFVEFFDDAIKNNEITPSIQEIDQKIMTKALA